jgi:hypothetical protein
MPQELSPKSNDAENHGKRRAEQPNPFRQQRTKSLDFARFKPSLGLERLLESIHAASQQLRPQHTHGSVLRDNTLAGFEPSLAVQMVYVFLIKQPTRSYRVMALHTHTHTHIPLRPPLTSVLASSNFKAATVKIGMSSVSKLQFKK